jgi:hypothetical protein
VLSFGSGGCLTDAEAIPFCSRHVVFIFRFNRRITTKTGFAILLPEQRIFSEKPFISISKTTSHADTVLFKSYLSKAELALKFLKSFFWFDFLKYF